ncbi:MAG TPA: thymidine kinase [Patescibacteria group bacterium]|nr:thymidine kinase [Patescibacteria group bacterium]
MTERLEVITGCMFAGKTDEMIRLAERQEYAGRKVQLFKPAIDTRWGELSAVKSHGGRKKDATPVKDSQHLLSLVDRDTKIVAIDEAQFLDEGIVGVVSELLDRDIKVLVAGLPLDFRGEPFGSMPVLLAKADNTIKVTAVCTHSENGEICGGEATRTQRFINGQPSNYSDPVIQIGEEEYAARCPQHHVVPGRPDKNKNVI